MLCNTYQEQSFHKMGKANVMEWRHHFGNAQTAPSYVYHSDNNVSKVVNER